jgi:hypothetical protein
MDQPDVEPFLLRHPPSEFELGRFVALANATGSGRVAYCALTAVSELLRVRVDSPTLAFLDHDAADDRVVQAARDLAIVGHAELPVPLVRMNGSMKLAERLKLVVDSAIPTPAKLRQIYGDSERTTAIGWFYLLRPVDVLRRRGRECWNLLRDSECLAMAFRYGESRRVVEHWLDGRSGPAFPPGGQTTNAQ